MKIYIPAKVYFRAIAFSVSASILAACGGGSNSGAVLAPPITGLQRINHIVVIYQENWSFDALYSQFPGANGVGPGTALSQTDQTGVALATLPQPLNNGAPDPRFPANMPLKTYDASTYVAPTAITGDIVHKFYHEQLQIDGGKMDQFVYWSDNGGLVPSEFNAVGMPEGVLASQYTMLDNMFHSAFGGSFLNHQFLICACAPTWPGAPANYISTTPNSSTTSATLNDNHVTPDGFVVNTSFATYAPHPTSVTAPNLVPPLTNPTIGDRMDAAGVSWKWYSGGWNNALAGNPDPLFQFHHQAFAYYKNYADGTAAKAAHLQDEANLFTDIANGPLPAVSFVKPLGPDNEHPGYASLLQGQNHVASIVNAIKNSPYWNDTVIIVTYDENGGRWDHVAPPVIDRWGPGSRVPGIIISKFAKKGFVDHTQYETASILKLIETRFGLTALGTRDANANGFTNALDMTVP